jgi:hypothetical protein
MRKQWMSPSEFLASDGANFLKVSGIIDDILGMEMFFNTNLTIPINQIILLLLLSTLALLFGKIKIALIINYLFTLAWGYIFNRDNLMTTGYENMEIFAIVYFGFGIGVILIASFAFICHRD